MNLFDLIGLYWRHRERIERLRVMARQMRDEAQPLLDDWAKLDARDSPAVRSAPAAAPYRDGPDDQPYPMRPGDGD